MACLHEKELWDNRWCPVTCFYCTGDQKKRCEHNKTTNADIIRAMNDEALSVFLWCFEREEVARESDCIITRTQILKWLQSPVEKGGE